MTSRHPVETDSLTWARADPGPPARQVDPTRSRIVLSGRGCAVAVLVSPAGLAAFDKAARAAAEVPGATGAV